MEASSKFNRLMAVGGIVGDDGPCGCGRWLLHGLRYSVEMAINFTSKLQCSIYSSRLIWDIYTKIFGVKEFTESEKTINLMKNCTLEKF